MQQKTLMSIIPCNYSHNYKHGLRSLSKELHWLLKISCTNFLIVYLLLKLLEINVLIIDKYMKTLLVLYNREMMKNLKFF